MICNPLTLVPNPLLYGIWSKVSNSFEDIELNSKDIVFEDSNIYVHYEEDAVTIPIVRRLGSNTNKIISSVCRTRPLTAISGLHFVPMRDNLTFGINESQKFIRLDLNQKDFENEEGSGIIYIKTHVQTQEGTPRV